jgi:hypothetical protein
MRGVEGARKQVKRAFAFDFAVKIGEDYGHVAAEFPDDLAAGAAGRRERVRIGDDSDSVEFMRAFALGESLENGDAFGAEGQAVAGVFDVAAGEDASGFGSHGSTDAKMGERRVGVVAGGSGSGDELVVVCLRGGHGKDYD